MEQCEVDELLVGYVLGALDADAQRQAEEALDADPALHDRLLRLQRLLSPLASDREGVAPPADLATRTIARVAEYICRDGLPPRPAVDAPLDAPSALTPERLRVLATLADAPPAPSRWRRPDLVVAASVLFLATALSVASVPIVRQKYQVWSCANNLRQLHQALSSYSDWHGGHYPKIQDEPPDNTADAFASMLRKAGLVSQDLRPACPAQGDPGPVLSYAYSLGYRDGEGRLIGLRYDEEQRDFLPILADRPSMLGADVRGNGPDHRTGQNVLYLSGAVRFCTTPLAGVEGDDIYLNRSGFVSAGVNRIDTVLGVGNDTP